MKISSKVQLTYIFLGVLLFASCSTPFEDPAPDTPVILTPNTTIKALKDQYAAGSKEVLDDLIVGGKVISTDEFGNFYRSIFIQDSTGGIEIKVGKTTLYNLYKEGQTVYVKAKHLYLGSSYGLINIGEQSFDPSYETSYLDTELRIKETLYRGSQGTKVTPQEITSISQITESMIGSLICIKNGTYVAQNVTTWGPPKGGSVIYGNHTFRLGTSSTDDIDVRISQYATFAAVNTPALGSTANITGILYPTYQGRYQLVINSLQGVEILTTP